MDYGEWKFGRRLTGISFSGTLFVLKMGLALSGAAIGWSLAGSGYVSGAVTQTPSTTRCIVGLFTLVPASCYALSALVARWYRLRGAEMRAIATANNAAEAAS